MKLFHAWLSSASRRVRLCLAEKQIAYESVPVDLGRQEQHTPQFLAMNPNGVVPALEIKPGQFLYESSTICEYLDDIQPNPPLRPQDPYELGCMRNFVRWTDEKVLPSLLILNWTQMLQPAAQGWSEKELQEKLARIPTPERREAWLRVARKPYTADERARALQQLLELVDRMEAMLDASPWLVGGAYSLADIAAIPFIARVSEIEPAAVCGSTHPHVQRWWRAVQQRPAYNQARLQRFGDALSARQNSAAAVGRS